LLKQTITERRQLWLWSVFAGVSWQFMSEKIGGAKGTELDDDFILMEKVCCSVCWYATHLSQVFFSSFISVTDNLPTFHYIPDYIAKWCIFYQPDIVGVYLTYLTLCQLFLLQWQKLLYGPLLALRCLNLWTLWGIRYRYKMKTHFSYASSTPKVNIPLPCISQNCTLKFHSKYQCNVTNCLADTQHTTYCSASHQHQ